MRGFLTSKGFAQKNTGPELAKYPRIGHGLPEIMLCSQFKQFMNVLTTKIESGPTREVSGTVAVFPMLS